MTFIGKCSRKKQKCKNEKWLNSQRPKIFGNETIILEVVRSGDPPFSLSLSLEECDALSAAVCPRGHVALAQFTRLSAIDLHPADLVGRAAQVSQRPDTAVDVLVLAV